MMLKKTKLNSNHACNSKEDDEADSGCDKTP